MWPKNLPLHGLLKRLCKAHGVDFKKYVVTDKFGEKIEIDKPLCYVNCRVVFLHESTAVVKRKLLCKVACTSNISDKIYRNKQAEAEAQKELEMVLSSKEKERKEEYQYIFGTTIEEAAEDDKGIPKFLKQAMDRLIQEATKSPNTFNCLTIFPKNLNEVPTLEMTKNALENGLLTIEEVPDLRTVAALVIYFFADLTEPIFSVTHFNLMIKADEISDIYWRKCVLHTLLLRLPMLHREIIKFMCNSIVTLSAADPTRSSILQHLYRSLGPHMLLPTLPHTETSSSNSSSKELYERSSAVTSEFIRGKPSGVTSEIIRGKPSAVTSEFIRGKPSAVTSGGKPSAVTSEFIRGKPSAVTSEFTRWKQMLPPMSPKSSKLGSGTGRSPRGYDKKSSSPRKVNTSSLTTFQISPLPNLQPSSTNQTQKKSPLSHKNSRPHSPKPSSLPASVPDPQKSPRPSPCRISPRTLNPEEAIFRSGIRKRKLKWINRAVTLMESLVIYRDEVFEWQSGDLHMAIIENQAVICYASLDKLIDKLIDENYQEQNFTEAFFVCHQYILPADQLFDKFVKLFVSNPPFGWQIEIRKRILLLLKLWFLSTPVQDSINPIKANLSTFLEQKPLDEREALLFKNVHKHLVSADSFANVVEEYRPWLAKEVTSVERYWDMQATIFSNDGTGVRQIVEHLALIDLDLYCGISTRECLHKRWMKSEEAPGFQRMAVQFNKLSLWVQSLVLNQENPSDRIYLLTVFIDMATKCVQIHNYHSAMSFYTAFHSVALSRLSAWKELPKKAMKQWGNLQCLFDFEKNYFNYRKESCDSYPVIPVLGIISKDLFALEENNPNLTSEGLVNFHKFRMLYRLIKYIKKVQRSTFTFKKIENLFIYLTNLSTPNEKELYALSLWIEPKDQSHTPRSGVPPPQNGQESIFSPGGKCDMSLDVVGSGSSKSKAISRSPSVSSSHTLLSQMSSSSHSTSLGVYPPTLSPQPKLDPEPPPPLVRMGGVVDLKINEMTPREESDLLLEKNLESSQKSMSEDFRSFLEDISSSSEFVKRK